VAGRVDKGSGPPVDNGIVISLESVTSCTSEELKNKFSDAPELARKVHFCGKETPMQVHSQGHCP